MPALTEHMKSMLSTQLPLVATVTDAAIPNLGPKRSLRMFDENTLIFNENTGGQTLRNIRDGSKVAVAVVDREMLDGYRFLGSAQLHASGDAYDDAVEFAAQRGMARPQYAVLIHLEEIFTLRPGSTAGTRV